MNIYFISGVGADSRIFHNITLPKGYHAMHLDWITPEKHEGLREYAIRLAANIDHSRPFALAGLSFGGMLANEIARIYPPVCVILISSIPSSKELPPYYKLAGKLGLHKLIPVRLMKSASLLKRLFTAETKEEKIFLRDAIKKADPEFIRWSLDAIIRWRNENRPHCYVHIHGSGDLILPLRYSGATHIIRGEGHLMVLTKGKEISKIISDKLMELQSAPVQN